MEHKVKTPNKPCNSDIFRAETGADLFIRDGFWYVSGDIDAEEAQSLLDAHNPPKPTEPTVQEKLALVGLSVDDLKSALRL